MQDENWLDPPKCLIFLAGKELESLPLTTKI